MSRYVERSVIARSPNGVLWLLWGTVLYGRIGARRQFVIRAPWPGRRAVYFGIGKRAG